MIKIWFRNILIRLGLKDSAMQCLEKGNEEEFLKLVRTPPVIKTPEEKGKEVYSFFDGDSVDKHGYLDVKQVSKEQFYKRQYE